MKVILIILSSVFGEEILYISEGFAYTYNTSVLNGEIQYTDLAVYDLKSGEVYRISENKEHKKFLNKMQYIKEIKNQLNEQLISKSYGKFMGYDAMFQEKSRIEDRGNVMIKSTFISIPLINMYLKDHNKIKRLPYVGLYAEYPYWFCAEKELFGRNSKNELVSEYEVYSLKSVEEIDVDQDFFTKLMALPIK